MSTKPPIAHKIHDSVPADYIVPEKYADRVMGPGNITTAGEVLGVEAHEDQPIVIKIMGYEIVRMNADPSHTPYKFTQFLLDRFKQHGAPVEGMLRHKLAHGAVVKVKPDPAQKELFIRYMWLPQEHCEALALAKKGLVH